MRHLLLSTVLFCTASLAQAEDAALIVGISDYDTLRDVRGADQITEAGSDLQDMGFTVYGTGASGGLQAQANNFAAEASGADRLVVVLAGQFVTDGQRTWLLPANAAMPGPFSVGNGALSVETALEQLGQTPGAAVLVLGHEVRDDGDLSNGLQAGIGDLDIPSGVTVVQGSVAATADLLSRVIATPGGDIIAGVRGSRDLTGSGFMPSSLVLVQAGAQPAPRPTPPTTAPDAPSLSGLLEASLWEQTRTTDTEQGYARYLDRYPDGAHARASAVRMTELRDPSFALKRAEDALNLPLEARRAVQRDLQVLGYDTRGIDGIFGPGTRGAVKAWQGGTGLAASGYLDAEQIALIDQQAATRSAQLEAEAQTRRAAEQRADRAFWAETGISGTGRDLRAYLERYPDGQFAKEAKDALGEIRARNRAAAAQADQEAWDKAVKRDKVAAYSAYLSDQPNGAFRDDAASRITQLQQGNTNQAATDAAIAGERALSLDPISLRLVEARLSQLGLDPGPVDGTVDADTRRAIRRYQKDRQLTSTGYLDQATVSQMLTDAFR